MSTFKAKFLFEDALENLQHKYGNVASLSCAAYSLLANIYLRMCARNKYFITSFANIIEYLALACQCMFVIILT